MRKYVLLIVAFVFHSFALSADNYTFCYWVDDNHTAAQTITRTTNKLDATVNVASLSPGMHTLFVRAKKNTGGWTSPKATHFFKVLNPTTVKTYYWFDDNEDNRFNVDKVNGETFAIDVSHLSDGTHTLHVRMEGEGAMSATVSNQFLKISTNFDAYYWFDNETERRTFTNAGGSAMLIDVSHLKDGLHCFNAMLTNDVGSPSVPVSRTFIKMPQPLANDSTTLTFWIDGAPHSEQKLAYGNEIVNLELDVADLTTGMHYLQVQAVTNSGSASNIVSGYFMRMPGQNNNSVLAYRYWVNDDNADLAFTAVDDPTIPYTFIGDLDVAPQPLRCARFHFEVNNDMPMLYAENDIHVQFMAADGHLITTTNAYVESVAADTLTTEEWTEIKNDTVIKADKPTGETIYWYAMNLEAGDTVCLKTNYSSTLQVFSHSGNQVFESKADSSLIFRQFVAEKAEMYYLALHTVNTNKAQVTLTVDMKEYIRYFNVETSAVGNGTVTEGGTYAEGTEITLTATPDEGYQFTQWSDGNTDNPRTLVLTQDTSLVAHFEIIYLQPDTVTLCYGETYQWHDKTYDASGVYIDTISSGVATLYLTILPQVEETIEEATICSGETYTWQADGKVYAESGTYSVTLQDINGCDSVVILHLTVNPIATTEETIVACDTYEWNGQIYTQSGEYVYTTTAANGCDSIVTLHLTINNSEIGATEYVTICSGETYTWNGQTYSTEGEYSITLTNALGCDSTATLHLTIMPEAITTTETVVVGSDELPYTWRGNTYSATGQYTVVEQYTTVACDSAIYVLDLMVLSTGNYDEQSVTICETEAPYTWYGESYSATGKYTYTEKYAGTDIDSVQHILNLTVNPTLYTTETVVVCDTYHWNGETYAESGEYVYTTTATTGCDSIVTLHLTINKSEHVEFSMTACDSYEWHGITYTQSGDYTYNTTTDAGCEHVEVLHLTINKSEHVEFSMTACDAYEWHGLTYTQSGDYTYTTTTAAGCERVEVLHLTINKSEHVEFTETACDSYVWNGVTYTESGDYTYTTTTAAGCERVEVLHLTINKSEHVEFTETACDSYEWNGVTYTESGDYTYTTTTAAGCERVEVLHLTINKSEREEYTEVACDEYVWNGVTYTESGDYTYTTTTAAGCERVEVLHLTINKSEYEEFFETACDSYVWNGVTYTESGDYTYTTTTAAGCERVEVLHLTINKSEHVEFTETACDSYVWNGVTYTESGDYTYNTTTAAGCERVEVLHLTINKFEHVEFTETACDEYVWNGVTYTESGDYTYTTTTAAGCERVEVLHLTINKSEHVEETVNACDSYEWNGVTYTESGDYTYNTTTAAGCERVEILHLTINKSEREEYTEVACDEYVWNGVTYTESGDYTYNTTTAAGCERVEVLHLTINKSEHIEETVTACDSYEWNDVTYTESGDYTYTTTTDQGCERVEVLHLTILPAAITDSEELALCPSELPYEWYGQTLTEAGSYTATEQYAGMECDSIIHELTVNVYVQTLPATVTQPIVRTGESINVSIPTAEIQAHIAVETWYAPNAEVAWYIMENSDWTALTTDPVAAGTKQVTLKYAVETDCGNIESDNMVINVIPTSVENTDSQSPIANCQKVLHEDHIYILRDGKMYTIMGQEL